MCSEENKVLDLDSEKVSVWLARPFPLVSLLEMKRFYAQRFYRISLSLEKLESVISSEASAEVIDEDDKKALLRIINKITSDCKAIGLPLSVKSLERMEKAVTRDTCSFGEVMGLVLQLHSRIEDELGQGMFMQIPRSHADYYDQPALFGPEVANNFSDATYDISEAGNCYATERYTACVMHLMRALEVALDAVGLGVGVPNAAIEAHNSWERLLKKISEQIGINDKSGDPAWQLKRQFFVDTHAHLFSVKNAWRNPSMHLEKKYDDKEAIRIYNAVKDFMEHLATHLDALGNLTH